MILFIFEGKSPDKHYLQKICKYAKIPFDTEVKTIYGTVIYQLYTKLQKDEYLDLITLLQEKQIQNSDNLKIKDITEVYLFFDYDPHTTNFDNQKLLDMLNLFDNETDKGKLFISYPMVEALIHLKDDGLKHINYKIDECRLYKKIAKKDGISKIETLTNNEFKLLIDRHLMVANNLVNAVDEIPKEIISQTDILLKQIEKQCYVVVLSSYPLFYLDYTGIRNL